MLPEGRFTIDLKSNEAQTVLAFEANNNAFLILGKFDTEEKADAENIRELRGLELRTENLIADGKYVFIECAKFIRKTPEAAAGVLCVFGVSNQPNFDWVSCEGIDVEGSVVEFEVFAEDKFQVHISFNKELYCSGTIPIDDGDWPCKENGIG
ncbi:MAG: hypothetical protein AAGL34_04060 [Bacteroidota bacterium]